MARNDNFKRGMGKVCGPRCRGRIGRMKSTSNIGKVTTPYFRSISSNVVQNLNVATHDFHGGV